MAEKKGARFMVPARDECERCHGTGGNGECPRCDGTGAVPLEFAFMGAPGSITSWLAEFFEIDLNKVEEERRAILDGIRSSGQLEHLNPEKVES